MYLDGMLMLDIPRKATLACVPEFFSRDGFSHSFPSSTVKSNFVYQRFNRSPLVGPFIFILFYFFSEKNSVCRDRTYVLTCQKLTRLPLSYRGDLVYMFNVYSIAATCCKKINRPLVG